MPTTTLNPWPPHMTSRPAFHRGWLRRTTPQSQHPDPTILPSLENKRTMRRGNQLPRGLFRSWGLGYTEIARFDIVCCPEWSLNVGRPATTQFPTPVGPPAKAQASPGMHAANVLGSCNKCVGSGRNRLVYWANYIWQPARRLLGPREGVISGGVWGSLSRNWGVTMMRNDAGSFHMPFRLQRRLKASKPERRWLGWRVAATQPHEHCKKERWLGGPSKLEAREDDLRDSRLELEGEEVEVSRKSLTELRF